MASSEVVGNSGGGLLSATPCVGLLFLFLQRWNQPLIFIPSTRWSNSNKLLEWVTTLDKIWYLLLSCLNSTQITAVFPIAIKTIKFIVTRPRIWSQTKGQRH